MLKLADGWFLDLESGRCITMGVVAAVPPTGNCSEHWGQGISGLRRLRRRDRIAEAASLCARASRRTTENA